MLSPELLEIINGYSLVEVGEVIYRIYLPTLSIIHESMFHASQAEKELRGRVFDDEDIESLKDKLLTKDEITLLETFEEQTIRYKRDLEFQTNVGKKQLTRNKIKQLEEDKERVDIKWRRAKLFTSNGYSYIIQTQFCLFKCVVIHDMNEPLWKSYNEFLDEERSWLIYQLMTEYINLTTKYTDVELRKIAKEGYYRVIYTLIKENQISFVSEIQELSMIAIRLLYWMTYYTNVIQGATEECPTEILEDNVAFDNWAERVRKGVTTNSEPPISHNQNRVKGKHRETIVISNS